ncbi:MAG: ATP-binding protein [Spirochaetales bacterium]|nr:ATP-binding protein [Spirochaetales bacterium]
METSPELKKQDVINNCYILQKRVMEDIFAEYWEATAIFSAQTFLLRFLKMEAFSPDLINSFYSQTIQAVSLRHSALLPTLEVDRHQGRVYVASDGSGYVSLPHLLQEGLKLSLLHVATIGLLLIQALELWSEKVGPYSRLDPSALHGRKNGTRLKELRLLSPGYGTLISSTQASETPIIPESVRQWGAIIVYLLTFETQPNELNLVWMTTTLRQRRVPEALIAILLKTQRHSPQLRYQTWDELRSDWEPIAKELQWYTTSEGSLADPLLVGAGLKTTFIPEKMVEGISADDAQRLYPQLLDKSEETLQNLSPFIHDNLTFSTGDLLDFALRQDLFHPGNETLALWQKPKSANKTTTDALPRSRPSPQALHAQTVQSDEPQMAAYEAGSPTAPSNADKIPWYSESGSVSLVLQRLTNDWRKAAVQTGSLRFVEEPHHSSPIGPFLLSLKTKALYLELPDQVVQGTLEHFQAFLDTGWERQASDRSPSYVRRLRQRWKAHRKSEIHEASLVNQLTALGTKATPLVVVLHHAQKLSRVVHDVLLAMRRREQGSAFCIFAFFEPEETPEWHALHQLPLKLPQ